jgi:hypothetical protein
MNTPDLKTLIRSLVERWLDSPDRPDLTETVRASGALPVYSDVGGTLLLRPNGEILFLDAVTGDDEPQLETDQGWRITAVVVGAERYPELRPLLPIRPAVAEKCDACAGQGRIRVAEISHGFLCGTCRGLGWLAPPS